MARVPVESFPEVTPPLAVPNDYLHVEARPEAFGAGIARGAQQLGAGALTAVENLGQIQADDLLVGAMDRSNKAAERLQSLHGADAINGQQAAIDEVNDAFSSARDQLATPELQHYFDQRSLFFRERYINGSIKSHVDRESDSYARAVNGSMYETGKSIVAAHPDDPSAIQQGLALMNQASTKSLALLGQDKNPAIVQRANDSVNADFLSSRIDSLLVDRPERAAQVFNANRDFLAGTPNYAALAQRVQNISDRAAGNAAARQVWNGADNPNQGRPAFKVEPVSPQLAQQAAITEEQRNLANFLWKGEGAGERTLYGGQVWGGSLSAHPADLGWKGGVGPDGQPTHAAGIPQFQPATWRAAAAGAGVSDFSAPSQVKAGLWWAQHQYLTATGGDLLTDFKAGKTDQIATALHGEWPSLNPVQRQATITGNVPPLQSMQAAMAPPEVDHMIGEIEDRRDRGELTDAAADHAIGLVTRDYRHWQQATAQDRAQLEHQITDGTAMLASGRDWIPDEARIRRLLPPEKAAEALQTIADAREAGQAFAAVQFMTPDEVAAKRAQIAQSLNDPTDFARKQRYANAFEAALKRSDEALKADPAAYVAAAPTVQTAWYHVDPKTGAGTDAAIGASLTEQARLGVPEEKQRALSKDMAATMSRRIMSTDPGTGDIGATLANAQKLYGRYWPKVMGDLKKAGLSSDYMILGAMDTPDQAGARSDMQRMLQFTSPKGGAKQLDNLVESEAKKEIDQSLDTALSSFRDTTRFNGAGGATLYTEVHDSVRDLAYWYSYEGQNASRAVQSAYDGVIGAKYDFDGTMRVPKGQMAAVEDATRAIAAQLTPQSFGAVPGNPNLTQEQRQAIYSEAVHNGQWVPNEDDTGLVLMLRLRNNQLLTARTVDGKRIELKFSDLPKLRVQGPAVPPAPGANEPGDAGSFGEGQQ